MDNVSRLQKKDGGIDNSSMVQVTDEKLSREIEYGLSVDPDKLGDRSKSLYTKTRIEQELAYLNKIIVANGSEEDKIKPKKIENKLNKR